MFSNTKNSLAAAGIAALTCATPAQAAIVVVEVGDSFSGYSNGGGFIPQNYDLNNDGTFDIKVTDADKGGSPRVEYLPPIDTKAASTYEGLYGELSEGDSIGFGFNNTSVQLMQFSGCCTPGTGIEPSSPLLPSLGNSDTAFFGVRFPGSGGFLEGWLEFSATGTNLDDYVLTFERYAYEDTGAAITVGQVSAVPLPAAGPLLASGLAALGFASRRRKKRQG